MARESCNRDKDEAEILKVPSSSSSPAPPQPPSAAASPPSMFLKHPQDYPIQRSERPEMLAVDAGVTFSSHAQKQGREESSHPQPVPEISTSNSGVPSCSRKRKHEEEGHQPPVPLINRCLSCQKRVGLMGFRCRCGDLFCSRHRYSDAHDCSFDYKSAGREEIAKANPVIRAAKIVKI